MTAKRFSRRELNVDEAQFTYTINSQSSKTLEGIVGQPRAMKALEMGLSINSKGYNIFVSGDPGTGRSTAIRLATRPFLEDLTLLKDIAFIHNFTKADSPIALTFAPGEGRAFLLKMKEFVNQLKLKIKELATANKKICSSEMESLTTKLLEPLLKDEKEILLINHYLHIKQDLLEHLYLFDLEHQTDLPSDNFYQRYSVNLLVDHSHTKSRPLIFETHPTFNNLFGSLDLDSDICSDTYLPFLSIRSGSLLEAAGGYIVISAEELLTVEGLWEAFKRFLTTNTLVVQNTNSPSSKATGIRPYPIPLSLKVILVGSEFSYDTFCDNDLDFLKLFKVSAEFDYTMKATSENIQGTISFMNKVVKEESLFPLKESGIGELLRFSSFIAESRDELTTQLSLIGDLMQEANYVALQTNKNVIDKECVIEAVNQRNYVTSITETKIFDEILSGEMIISLEGSKIGVVNALAILDRGSASFGVPAVISATVAPGSEGIVNIEHEAGLSGEIHDKGLLILEGYLRKQYARNFPLSIYSGICFEQSYGSVDGDSASSSELYALLSAIGEIPIKQNIAVTGSVNQMGELQPVGGINEKIGGFFNLCKYLNLKNHPGVIIPIQNIKSLVLPYEIINAIEKKEFHIYPIRTIDEGMEILTDRPSGERNQKGNFPPDTLNKTIEQRLKRLYEISRPPN
ncbi:MAG: Lon protease family protein [Sphaerochaetaceae bacterium]|jgi:lon-related putative ATP-dependent protease